MRDTSALPLLLLSHNCNKIGRKKRVSLRRVLLIKLQSFMVLFQARPRRSLRSFRLLARGDFWNIILRSRPRAGRHEMIYWTQIQLKIMQIWGSFLCCCVWMWIDIKKLSTKKLKKTPTSKCPEMREKELKSRDLSSRSRLNGVLLFGEERTTTTTTQKNPINSALQFELRTESSAHEQFGATRSHRKFYLNFFCCLLWAVVFLCLDTATICRNNQKY